jgi:putative multiple sugar transport system substrate-binding protein
MSVFKDTRDLAKQAVAMAVAISKGEKPEVNDTTTYDNGVFIVPTFLCDPVFADITNYEKLLIESGYYTADQLK